MMKKEKMKAHLFLSGQFLFGRAVSLMQILSLSETIDGSLRDAMGQDKERNDSGSVHQPFLGRIASNIVALGGLLLMRPHCASC
ncbi:MAG: hypothetical protein ABF968_12315 [Acetobacter sp.]|uniref:hypothetical protein n=1 Tax=Acetobacter sp. TaxID=440 RepID=UPI0039ED4C98